MNQKDMTFYGFPVKLTHDVPEGEIQIHPRTLHAILAKQYGWSVKEETVNARNYS